VAVDIKFCGLTRAYDAEYAAALGAKYVGVIFAGGPRHVTPERARDVLRNVPSAVRRVGVFAEQSTDDIARTVRIAGLNVVQLHSNASSVRVEDIRAVAGVEVWPVLRVTDALPITAASLIDSTDALLLDAYVPGTLGGAGVSFPWASIANELRAVRGDTPIVLAGGLRAENVAEAIAVLSPDVVDVSSGVESAPGLKDHDRMRAFRDAVTHAPIST
jgi:phosphoribosylanthranilate isomerase